MATATLVPKELRNRAGLPGLRHTDFRPHLVDPSRRVQPSLGSVLVRGVTRPIRIQFASTYDEWEEAFQLVADKYMARGYAEAGTDLRFTSYHALPDTVVLIAKLEGQVVATLSLVPDNTLLGLPLESLYRAEVQALRRQGRRLFETTSLADRALGTREFVQVFMGMMQFGWQHAVGQGADTTLITVNPRHSNFYTRLHGFLPLGPRRAYDKVQGHPAEAFYLNPKLMQVRAPEMYQRLLCEPLPRPALQAPRMPPELVRHFARRSSQTTPQAVEQILWLVDQCGSPRRW